MSDSNRINVAGAVETTIGTAATGAYQALNVSSCNLKAQKNTAEANTIRSDRNLPGLIMTELFPQGGIGFDWMYGNLDFLLPGLFGSAGFSTLVSLAGITGTITSTNIFTAGAGTPFSVCVVGQWLAVVMGGVKTFVRITAIGGGGASITTTGATWTNGAATITTAKGKYMRNGTTMSGYTLEVQHADEATKPFFAYLGCIPNSFSLNAIAQQVVTGDMQFLGLVANAPAAATLSSGAYTAAVTTDTFAGLNGNFGLFMVGGTVITPSVAVIKGIDVQIAANVRRDVGINASRAGWGQFTLTGKLSTFFKGGMQAVDDFYSHATSSIAYVMGDAAGNYAVITMGAVKFSDFDKQVGGKNQAVMGDLNVSAILDTTYSNTMQFDYLPA